MDRPESSLNSSPEMAPRWAFQVDPPNIGSAECLSLMQGHAIIAGLCHHAITTSLIGQKLGGTAGRRSVCIGMREQVDHAEYFELVIHIR
jgi:hypothetical protein